MSVSETPITVQELPDPAVCLDFANTVGGTRERPTESLFGYADLLAWCRAAGLVTDAAATRLAAASAASPVAAAAVFARAVALREAIYRLFSAVADGRPVAPADLDLLNGELAMAEGQLRLIAQPAGVTWGWPAISDPPLDRPLWPLARAAADLLTSDQRDRVRECDGATCAWLFIDHSRNRSRRWCDMADCGNRAKAHRHRQRQRATTA